MSLALADPGEQPLAMIQGTQALEIYEQIEDPYTDRVRRQLAEWRQEGAPPRPPGPSGSL
jgi:hypothetical protein